MGQIGTKGFPPISMSVRADSSEVRSRWVDRRDEGTSGQGSAANSTLHTPTYLLEVSPFDEDYGSKGNLMEALGLISWEVGHLDV